MSRRAKATINQLKMLKPGQLVTVEYLPLEKYDWDSEELPYLEIEDVPLILKGKEKVVFLGKDLRDETPTVMKNNRFVRPFESLVRMYGTPTYSEIDPTPFLAITFPLLFGLMFGDIGHGLVLVIAGLIGGIKYREKKKGTDFLNFCWIIFYCGWGAILGGILYGEFFGMHDIEIAGTVIFHLEPVTIPILNITLHDPLDNIMTVFFFAVLMDY